MTDNEVFNKIHKEIEESKATQESIMCLELTKKQIKAVKSLAKAFKKCSKAKLYIHNCWGRLIAYDANVVDCDNDEKTPILCDAGTFIDVPHDLDLASWADETHYVQLREE